MLVQFLQKNKFFSEIIYKAEKLRARDMVERIKPYLKNNDVILDIGSGSCGVCEILLKKGYRIKPLDVQNLSFVNNLNPVIYDGNKIPFKENEFDKSLILNVLHHTSEPEKILSEAKRVSRGIIIMEDIYINRLHKYLTYFLDSLLNLEFIRHPHNNKTDGKWKKTLEKLGLKLINAEYHSSFLFFRHATYYLEK